MGNNKDLNYLDYNNFDDAKEIVLRFRDEYLHGNIEELANFSFWDIAGNPKYDGTCTLKSLGKFDGDKTKIVYAIDYLLYGEKIKKLVKKFSLNAFGDTSEYKANFSGDTINTFRTSLGNRFLLKNGEIEIENFFDFTYDLKQKRNDFFFTYQKIGNFYILPKVYRKSINQLRGTNNWKDYFDVFLKNLDECLHDNISEENKVLKNYLEFGINKEFFSRFESIDEFLDFFFMSDYKNLDFNHPNKKVLCSFHGYSEKDVSKKLYKEFLLNYISKATELINKRSKILVDELKKII